MKLADGQVVPLLHDVSLVVCCVCEVVVTEIQSGQFAQTLGGQVGADGTTLPVGVLILLAVHAGNEVDEQLCVSFVGAALDHSNTVRNCGVLGRVDVADVGIVVVQLSKAVLTGQLC